VTASGDAVQLRFAADVALARARTTQLIPDTLGALNESSRRGTIMGFRQNNKQMRDAKLRWDVFCTTNRELIERIGLPTPTIETQERFEDLLMHGYIDHHSDWSRFRVDQLDEGKYELFKRLVEQYFAAGYDDPGVMAVEPKERERLAIKYPKRFV
jgi:hypothetical protein